MAINEKQWRCPMQEDVKEAYVNMEMKFPEGDQSRLEELRTFYDTWAYRYEGDLLNLRYMAHEAIAQQAAKVATEEDKANWNVLDIGSGTGLVCMALRDKGFSGEFTALDCSQKMLEKSKGVAKLYTSFHEHCLTPSNPLPFEDCKFNLVVAAGAFGPEAVEPDCAKDIIRTLRPGGFLIFTSRISKARSSHNDMLFEVLAQLTKDGSIGEVSKEVFDQYAWETTETETERIRGLVTSCQKL